MEEIHVTYHPLYTLRGGKPIVVVCTVSVIKIDSVETLAYSYGTYI